MSDFYEVGVTYSDSATGWKFRVDCVTTHPEDGSKTALGWRLWGEDWEPYAYEEGDWEISQYQQKLFGKQHYSVEFWSGTDPSTPAIRPGMRVTRLDECGNVVSSEVVQPEPDDKEAPA